MQMKQKSRNPALVYSAPLRSDTSSPGCQSNLCAHKEVCLDTL